MKLPTRTPVSSSAMLGACVLLAWTTGPVLGQGTGGPVVSDSKVGYIDHAVPGDLVRFRYDTAYNNRRPTRGEFFYAPTAPRGPGLPFPERAVDYQDLSAYGEAILMPDFSAFVEVPVRFLNPDVNGNSWGLADMNAGFKYALLNEQGQVVTFQLRTYAPTGAPSRGLGNAHVSLEPAVLFLQELDERIRLEGELRYWVPVGGNEFAGSLVRYGLGVSYDLFTLGVKQDDGNSDSLRITPVAEIVGWTLLGGDQSVFNGADLPLIQGAAGDTIVNAKLGVRMSVGERLDLYAGGGRALTGERWYDTTFRFEARLRF